MNNVEDRASPIKTSTPHMYVTQLIAYNRPLPTIGDLGDTIPQVTRVVPTRGQPIPQHNTPPPPPPNKEAIREVMKEV